LPEPPIAGRTGEGLRPDAAYDLAATPFEEAMFELDRRQRLDTGRRTTGFTLSIAARLDPVQAASDVQPLVMVAAADTLAATGDAARSLAGLRLERSDDAGATGQPRAWALVGWVGNIEVDSVNHPVQAVGNVASSDNTHLYDATDPAHAIVGGTWEEFTLVWDGRAIGLLRNGRRIAEKTVTAPPDLPTGDVMAVVVGYRRETGPAAEFVTHGALDDVRLERIGGGLSANLPGDMRPSVDAVITCFPDGRIEVNGVDHGAIEVQSRNDNSLNATITIDVGGAVAVEKISK
jgi:hypothetical protein